MILKSIKLQNIRSYLSEMIEFPAGSVLLSGDIGSGKSTILLAIEFALFGVRRGQLSGDALLRNGKNEGSVELEFSINNKNVIIKRSLKRQKGEIKQVAGYLIVDGIKTDATAVELKAKVLELLGYPMSELSKSKDFIYRYTVYTPQEQMKQILLEAAELRLNTLRKVFNIDKYKLVRENSVFVIKSIKDRINLFKGTISDFEEKKLQKSEKEKDINRVEAELARIMPELDKVVEELKMKSKELEDFELKVKELLQLKHELEIKNAKLMEIVKRRKRNSDDIDELEIQIAKHRKEIEGFKLPEKPDNEKELFEKEIEALEKELLTMTESKTKVEQEVLFLQEQLKISRKEIELKTLKLRDLKVKKAELEDIEKQIAEKKSVNRRMIELDVEIKDLLRVISESEVLKKRAEELKSSIKRLENCPTCLQSVSDEHKRSIIKKEEDNIAGFDEMLKSYYVQKKELEKELSSLRDKFEDILHKERVREKLRSEISSLNEMNKEVVDLQKRYSEVSLKKMKLDYDLDNFSDEKLDELKSGLEVKRKLLKRFTEYESKRLELTNLENLLNEKVKRYDVFAKEQSSLKEQIALINTDKIEISNKINELEGVEDKLKVLKEENSQIVDRQKQLELNKAGLKSELETHKRFMQLIDDELKKKQDTKKQLQELKVTLNWLEDHFISLMTVIEKHVMSTVYIEFNELLQKWFGMLMQDESISIRLDEDFSPVIEQDGYEVSIENLSGGEKTSASLAYRLALNKVINDIQGDIETKDLIILDEPTDGFSSSQLDNVRDVLEELNVKQVIIVSHESKIESFVENIIRINKNEHVSSVIT
ncbi:SMC family ATPase [Candidatus Woesearchaeota archaeon]|nr:SMC family ATPase [Candidatus Woesearchaeota archaeon]